MKLYLIALLSFLVNFFAYSAEKQEVKSPNGEIKVLIEAGKEIRYSVFFKNLLIVQPSGIALNIAGTTNTSDILFITKTTSRSVNETIIPPVAEKRKVIPDRYNEITVHFNKPLSLIIRAYNDGIAFRWQTSFKDSIIIKSEKAEVVLNKEDSVWYSPVSPRSNSDIYHTSFEEPYKIKNIEKVATTDLIFTPTLIQTFSPKIVITESDLEDYPGMFLRGTGQNKLIGDFAPYPIEEKIQEGEFPQYLVTKRADYIAKTKGTRTYPWRVFLIAQEDRELPENDLVYRLGSPSRVKDVSWIKPGKGTDEWTIGINLFNVPFKTGVNTATYKYYIDFVKKFGFDRIMMDAGWSDYKDLFKINPDVDMNEISAYAKSKGIKISMWTLALTLEKQLEPALDQFNKWGVDFIMTDFIDRDDQKTVNFYYKIAEACARHKIMLMFHGAFKPAGFTRTWPNALTREGVLGSEYNIWSEKPTPEHDLLLPFIRMTGGPMDYEPGLLDNATQKTFKPISEKVMSQGTRCHQLAMFVVYESPVQFFSGNPSQGLLEPEFMSLLGSVPTTWDNTKVLQGKVGDYIVTARQKGNDWFLAGMTDWTTREIKLNLDFLGDGNFEAEICRDGVNADRYGSDYSINKQSITSNEKLTIKMAPGGGFLIRFKKK